MVVFLVVSVVLAVGCREWLLVVARVLHVLSPVIAFHDTGFVLASIFRVFCFYFFLFTVCLCDAQLLWDCLLA
jgi:hypothetical protein